MPQTRLGLRQPPLDPRVSSCRGCCFVQIRDPWAVVREAWIVVIGAGEAGGTTETSSAGSASGCGTTSLKISSVYSRTAVGCGSPCHCNPLTTQPIFDSAKYV